MAGYSASDLATEKIANAMKGLQWKPVNDLGFSSKKPEIIPNPANNNMMNNNQIVAKSAMPLRKSGNHEQHQMFTNTEESMTVKVIKETHCPDGVLNDYDSRFVLNLIEEIILRTGSVIPGNEHRADIQARLEELERETVNSSFTDLRDELAYPINKISAELICKVHRGGDGRKTTDELFQSLAHYSWEAKVVIAFAAFAKTYGEYWLVAQLFKTNPLARSLGYLMEVDEIVGIHQEALKPKFKAVSDLVNAVLDVTKSIFEFNDLLAKDVIAPDAAEKLAAGLDIPVAAYWTMRTIVACASIILNLMAMGHEYIATALESWELTSLAHKLARIKDHMLEQKNLYRLKLEEKRQHEAYLTLRRLFDTPHLDNMKILRALFCAYHDDLPLYNGEYRTRVRLEELRKKNVLILISGVQIPPQEFEILLHFYNESRQPSISPENRFEIVWLPVIDRSFPLTQDVLQKFEDVRGGMPWYSVAHPSLIDPAVNRFVTEVWKYDHKPLLVVLDPQGKVSNHDALNMLWIWGSLAFPFTDTREEALWNEASWNMELLVDAIDATVQGWLTSGRFVCLYGGEDIEWIKRFTTAARNVARQLSINLELLYVGKSNPRERVRRNNEIIEMEKLSSTFPDMSLIWFFWVRLNCMWNSREKQGMSLDYDEKMKQIVTILTYESSDLEWAIIGKGRTGETAKHTGEIMLQCLEDFNNWRYKIVDPQDFVYVLNEELRERHPKHHCSRLFYPGTAARAPPSVTCPECERPMDKYLMYRCCTD